MSQPRRNVQPKNYEMSSSDTETAVESEGSRFESSSVDSSLSDDPKDAISDTGDIDTFIPDVPPQPDGASVFPIILTESQKLQTRALLTEQTNAVENLRVRHQEQRDLAEALEAELNAAEKLLFETKAMLTSLNRIPAEILGVIFSMHVEVNKQSPWLLMQISRAWRAVALMTRRLWRGILITDNSLEYLHYGKHERSRNRDGMEVCFRESQLIGALGRSGACPLAIKVIATIPFHQSEREKAKSALTKLIGAISKHKKTPRIGSLEISTMKTQNFTLPCEAFELFSFSDLETLILDSVYPTITKKAATEAVALRTVRVPSSSLKHFQKFRKWGNVTNLAITQSSEEFDIPSILRQATSLISLDLTGNLLKPSDSDMEDIQLSSLEFITLENTFNLFPIQYSSVTHLNIVGLPKSDAPQPTSHSILLPHLVEISCSKWRHSMGLLRAFSAPSLHTLVLEGGYTSQINARGFKEIWPFQSGTTKSRLSTGLEPVVLRVRNISLNSKVLARILGERMRMKELHIGGGEITSDFLEALVPVRNVRHKASNGVGNGCKKGKHAATGVGWSVSCPELKTLIMHLNPLGDTRAESLVQLANDFIAQRERASVPLERFAIKLSNGVELQELIA